MNYWCLGFLPLLVYSLYQIYLEIEHLKYKKERKLINQMELDLKRKIEELK